jgi:hypothetical protein
VQYHGRHLAHAHPVFHVSAVDSAAHHFQTHSTDMITQLDQLGKQLTTVELAEMPGIERRTAVKYKDCWAE